MGIHLQLNVNSLFLHDYFQGKIIPIRDKVYFNQLINPLRL
jgi:hypothetical protein